MNHRHDEYRFSPDYLLLLISENNAPVIPGVPKDIAKWSQGWYDISGPTDYDMECFREATEDFVVNYTAHVYRGL